MLILYTYDSNEILVDPIRSISDTEILRAYDTLYDAMETTGHSPKLNIMYNESSTALKILLQKSKTVVQLSPLHIHRRNTAEQAILTFKNHFVAGLALVYNNFPIYMWCYVVS